MISSINERKHLIVIDPTIDKPELGILNQLAIMSTIPISYHLPAICGLASLNQENITSACGLIMLGSRASVNDEADWQLELAHWLKIQLVNGLPTLGLCFGHQFIAKIFGAEIAYAAADQAMCRGMHEIIVNETVWSAPVRGEVLVTHCEIVKNIPLNMEVNAARTGASESFIEGLCHRELPIWTFQSHPETDILFALEHIQQEFEFDSQQLAFGHGILQNFIDYTVNLNGKNAL